MVSIESHISNEITWRVNRFFSGKSRNEAMSNRIQYAMKKDALRKIRDIDENLFQDKTILCNIALCYVDLPHVYYKLILKNCHIA